MNLEFIKNYYPSLFTWKDLENIINIRPLMSVERFKISDGHYTWDNSPWVSDLNCFPASIIKEIFEKTIFYIRDMSKCNKKVNDLCKRIEQEYNSPTDAHIYVCGNPNLDHPFGIHFDLNDNVIVQCEGLTNFKVWDIVEDKTQNQSKMEMFTDPIIDVMLNPGDAIKIPAYYPHLASSVTKRLSISFPMSPNKDNKVFEGRDWIEIESWL